MKFVDKQTRKRITYIIHTILYTFIIYYELYRKYCYPQLLTLITHTHTTNPVLYPSNYIVATHPISQLVDHPDRYNKLQNIMLCAFLHLPVSLWVAINGSSFALHTNRLPIVFLYSNCTETRKKKHKCDHDKETKKTPPSRHHRHQAKNH